MTEYDLLFWLSILLIAVLAYAVESGVANQNRRLVFSTMLSVTLTSLYIMFLVEDNSSLDFAKPPPPPVEQAEGGEDMDGQELGEKKKKSAAAAAKPAGPADKAKAAQGPFTDCDVCPSMIVVSAGQFRLGSPPTERGRTEAEESRSLTITKDYAIGRFEIMREEFEVFVQDAKHATSTSCEVRGSRSSRFNWKNPGFEQTGKHPVVCVNWNDAKAYTAWLSKRSGKPYRLPSEAEWEYAARAGSQEAYYPGANIAPSHGNFARARDGTTPAGFFGSNLNGLFDVHGNVWEMMGDCWNADTSFLPMDGRALGLLGNCDYRTVRGGSWESPPAEVRSAMRTYVGLGAASNTMGFRVARTVGE
jgi:formylglycine-generating enzyme